ncbi:MAG: glycosyltransferase [Chloroflexi bacterium]|nr:glycosyltransferase [Chloroflexota bacterium]
MKILMLLPQFPWPADQGAKMRNEAFVRILAQEHELHLLCFGERPPEEGQLQAARPYCRSVRVLPPPGRSRLGRAAKLLTSPLPDMAARLWSPAFASALGELLAREGFDAVHVSNLELALYLRLVSGPKRVFDDHNAEYLLQRRAYETEVRDGWLGPLALYSLVQWRRLRRFEAWACRTADLVLAVSQQDARHLEELAPGIRPRVVPNGVDAEAYRALPLGNQPRPLLLFSGKLDYRPNEDAVRWFLDDILPRVWRARAQARFLVVGHAPPSWLVERGKQDARIVVTGPVPDDHPYLERSAAYVLPMRWGGGVRFKALVALASGRPLVSTSMGMDGVECVPGEHVLLADEPEAFAANVVRVLDDARLAASLARAGRALVEQRFAWPRIAPALLEAYRRLALSPSDSLG